MWLMTTLGFFSVVSSGGREGLVQIRSRKREDLTALLSRFGSRARIFRTPKRDYLYRTVVPTTVWQDWAFALAGDCEGVDNFKDAVKKVDPVRALIYGQVWKVCLEIEPKEETSF